jgi:ApbE superfamily uncharacterized protein (UPF0280 family)
MPLRSKKRHFDVPVQDMTLRITGPEELYDEARAAGMQFWEQVQAFAIRHREFQASKRPMEAPPDAPPEIRRMINLSASAGVGPMFTFRGALTEHVGGVMARSQHEVLVVCQGDYYVQTRKRARLGLHHTPDQIGSELAVVVKPELGPQGIFTSLGEHRRTGFSGHFGGQVGLAVVASSCILADAAAAAATAILSKPGGFDHALRFLQRFKGVHGAVVVQEERIGLAGGLELAA